MKKNNRGILTAFVATLLLSSAGAAFAQSDMGNKTTGGATYAVGVAESLTSSSVTLVLDSGERQTILLAGHTIGKGLLANGSRARIDYRIDEKGQAVAEMIQSGGAETTAVAVTAPAVRVEVTTPTPPVETYRAEPTARVEIEPRAAEVETTVTPSEIRSPRLPDTASSMPSLALLGLLSFVGAVALRFTR